MSPFVLTNVQSDTDILTYTAINIERQAIPREKQLAFIPAATFQFGVPVEAFPWQCIKQGWDQCETLAWSIKYGLSWNRFLTEG